MTRFKPGDHVRGAAGSQGYYTRPGELLGAEVLSIDKITGDVHICILKHTHGDFKGANPGVGENEIELIKEEPKP